MHSAGSSRGQNSGAFDRPPARGKKQWKWAHIHTYTHARRKLPRDAHTRRHTGSSAPSPRRTHFRTRQSLPTDGGIARPRAKEHVAGWERTSGARGQGTLPRGFFCTCNRRIWPTQLYGTLADISFPLECSRSSWRCKRLGFRSEKCWPKSAVCLRPYKRRGHCECCIIWNLRNLFPCAVKREFSATLQNKCV